MCTLENNQAHRQAIQALKGSSDRGGCGSSLMCTCNIWKSGVSVAYAREEVVSSVRQIWVAFIILRKADCGLWSKRRS